MILPILSRLSHRGPGCILCALERGHIGPLRWTEDKMVDLARTTSEGFPPRGGGLLPPRKTLKRAALALALLSGVATLSDFGYHYRTVGQYLVSTDDAYVKADYATVAPKVSGYIADVLVQDNERVVAGQM